MATEIEKSNYFGFSIKRGPGYGYSESFWGENPVGKDLPDSGARIYFGRPYSLEENFKLNIHFGYTSPSQKDYARSIDLDLGQTVELIKYLNECVFNELKRRDYMYYLAYGSNIYSPRLKERVPSATKVTNVKLKGYKLVFNKRSKDNSSKANIVKTNDESDYVYGVIFEIKKTDKASLDKKEGLGKGYNEKEFKINLTDLNEITATTYIADNDSLVDNLLPYDWYLDLIIKGALENEFPTEYTDKIKSLATTVDTDEQRRDENLK
jgi:gamma-glutamylcyclotransferase